MALLVESVCQCRRLKTCRFDPWAGRPPGGGNSNRSSILFFFHSSILAWKNPMGSGAWQATVHGVTNSHTRLSDLECGSPFLVSSIWKSQSLPFNPGRLSRSQWNRHLTKLYHLIVNCSLAAKSTQFPLQTGSLSSREGVSPGKCGFINSNW